MGLYPSFLSLRYEYRASVANQIASVKVTPRVLSGYEASAIGNFDHYDEVPG